MTLALCVSSDLFCLSRVKMRFHKGGSASPEHDSKLIAEGAG
jgi:hypothetical protein